MGHADDTASQTQEPEIIEYLQKLNIEDNILNNEKIIGKILINDKYPFGLVKIKEYKIDYLNSYKTKNALIKFIKPFWEN